MKRRSFFAACGAGLAGLFGIGQSARSKPQSRCSWCDRFVLGVHEHGTMIIDDTGKYLSFVRHSDGAFVFKNAADPQRLAREAIGGDIVCSVCLLGAEHGPAFGVLVKVQCRRDEELIRAIERVARRADPAVARITYS